MIYNLVWFGESPSSSLNVQDRGEGNYIYRDETRRDETGERMRVKMRWEFWTGLRYPYLHFIYHLPFSIFSLTTFTNFPKNTELNNMHNHQTKRSKKYVSVKSMLCIVYPQSFVIHKKEPIRFARP